jgi:hypothetical protein
VESSLLVLVAREGDEEGDDSTENVGGCSADECDGLGAEIEALGDCGCS